MLQFKKKGILPLAHKPKIHKNISFGSGLNFQATKHSLGGAGTCPRQGQQTEFGQVRSGCKVNKKKKCSSKTDYLILDHSSKSLIKNEVTSNSQLGSPLFDQTSTTHVKNKGTYQ